MERFLRGAFVCALLILSGCALNESASSVSTGDSNAFDNQKSDIGPDVLPLNEISMFVFPKLDSAGNEQEKGYFVEFELNESVGPTVIKYKD